MDLAYFAGDLWPSILPEAAVVCLGEPHCHSRGQRGGGAQDRIVEKKIQKETMDFLDRCSAKANLVEAHTPVPVMDLPVADVVDSASASEPCAMRGSPSPLRSFVPLRRSMQLECAVQLLCGSWHGDAGGGQTCPCWASLSQVATPMRPFGPIQTCQLGLLRWVQLRGADSSTRTPLLMEYPDQPRPPITVENVNSVMGKDSKKKVGGKEKHIFWAKTECGLVLSSVTPWEIISKEKGVTTGGYMCKHCQGFWKQGRGATRLVQIIGRNRGKKVSLQLIMDEPPEALYNQWIRDRIEYYKRVEPVAPPRDEQLDLGPPVARLRVSHSNDRGAVGQMIWASILSNRELSNLQYIGKVADKHAKRARSSGDATIA